MIQRLLITNFRILGHVELTDLKTCNLFVGQNGSGKTSLLEALFMLSRGKSFRHHQPRHYIAHGQDTATVFAEFTGSSSMAVAKSLSGESKLKVNSESRATQSELTRLLPVILLDPTQLDVLDHGSVERRGLLDWLVFHTQANFYKTWLGYQRALKQRNRLLKSYQDMGDISDTVVMQISAFDEQLVHLGEYIHAMRHDIINQWQPIFIEVCAEFLPQYERLSMRYSAGFDTELGLAEVLGARTKKDIELGYTRVGVHRADVMIYTDCDGHKKHAADVLSRGEKKLLIMALKLSQLRLLNAFKSQSVVLLDDIDAELDTAAIDRLLRGLQSCDSQLFITSLDERMTQTISSIWNDDAAVFGLENGHIS